MNKKEFGKRIQKVRKSRGLTARMLAEMISIDDTRFCGKSKVDVRCLACRSLSAFAMRWKHLRIIFSGTQ